MTQNPAARTNRNSVLVIATLCAFVVPFLVSSINVALPKMTAQFHMEAVVMTWVNTIYFLAIAMVQVPMGRLADIYGRKKLIILGILIALVAAVGGAMAKSVGVLLVSRAFQGIGAGMTFNIIIAVLTSIFPAETRGKALGISMAGTYGGLIMGPLIGGIMTERLGWPSIFILSAVFNLFLLLLIFLFIKAEWRDARDEKFDLTGSLIFAIGIIMFTYGFSSLPKVMGVIFTLAGLIVLACFVRWELKQSNPVMDLRIFKNNRIFLFCNLSTLANYMATYAVTFLLSLYLQYINAYSPQKAGLVMIAASIPMTIFTPLAGRISDKIEPRLVAATGLIVGCVALVMLIFLGNNTPLWYILIALVLYGTGIGLFSSPNTNAIMGAVDKKVLGVASGTVGTMRTSGMMLSMGIMMIIFALYIGQAEITSQYYPQFLTSTKVGFLIFTVIGVFGVVAQLAARKKA
jgi:MFS family permease